MSIKLSFSGKMFLGGIALDVAKATYDVITQANKPEIFTTEQISVMKREIYYSKKFQAELAKPGATVDSVIALFGVSNLTSAKYTQITGKAVPR